MKLYRISVGAVFTGLLTCGFLSGCVHHESTVTTNETLPISNTTKADSHKDDERQIIWNKMKACLKNGNIAGAVSYFSIQSKNDYQEEFQSLSKKELASWGDFHKDITPASIESNKAQYYFENSVNGQIITFPVEFVKESGQWKILEY
jgi:hypothetical protein